MPDVGATENNHSGSTLALVLVVLVCLFAATAYVNGVSRQEHKDISARHYQRGEQLMRSGKTTDAVEEYHAAVMLDRDNLIYQQALARALYQEGSMAEARSYLRPLLERDPIDGPTNLMLARILAHERGLPARRGFQPPSLDQVEDYYRRAVYGQWPPDTSARRLAARFELIDLLRGSGRRYQAIAELVALADDTPADPETQIRIANLLYDTGAAAQSADMFRALLKDRPRDSDLYAALARAQFELGHYRNARDSYRNAIRWKSDDSSLRQRLEVVNDIISLDPAQPRLSRAERMNRALRLLRRAVTIASECTESKIEASGGLDTLLEAASDFSDPKKRPTDAEAETGVDLAQQIWTESANICGSLEKRDEALNKVLTPVESQ